MTVLLDANLLIALAVADHVHHDAAESWLGGATGSFATCPTTQGALVRLLVREGTGALVAQEVVRGVEAHARHERWVDDVSYASISMSGVIGHRQVSDAYLAGLARRQGGRLATFDRGLAALHDDVAELVPTS
ncbi:MAG: TA system VapC family ribonuclease toxin [Acidimicrobiales bacterium]